jgi:hypothetical protein
MSFAPHIKLTHLKCFGPIIAYLLEDNKQEMKNAAENKNAEKIENAEAFKKVQKIEEIEKAEELRNRFKRGKLGIMESTIFLPEDNIYPENNIKMHARILFVDKRK